MFKLVMFIFFVATCFMTYGQDYWGYCFAKVSYMPNDSATIDYLFVSRLVNLNSLPCQSKISADTSRAEFENNKKTVDSCIVDWFYSRIKEISPRQAAFLSRKDVIADTRFFSNHEYMEKYMTGGHDYFLSRNDAEIRRGRFLGIVETNNRSKLVIVN